MKTKTPTQAQIDHYECLLRRGASARKRERLDALNRPTETLYAAGIEPSGRTPQHGYQSVHRIIDWFYDGQDSRYETN